MELNEIQLAFFFKEPKQISYDEFSYLFKKQLKDQGIFINFDTSIFPIPSGVPVPAEVPRCQISTNDQKFKITLTLDRCDINCSFDKTIGDIYNTVDYYNIAKIAFDLICKNIEVKRYGHVSNFIYVVSNPKKLIAEKLLKPKLEEPLVDTFIQFGKIIQINNVSFNKVYQFRSALRQNFSNGKLESIVFAVKDINTNDNIILNNDFFYIFLENTKDIIESDDILGFIE